MNVSNSTFWYIRLAEFATNDAARECSPPSLDFDFPECIVTTPAGCFPTFSIFPTQPTQVALLDLADWVESADEEESE